MYIYIYIYIYILEFNLRSSHTKGSKMILDTSLLYTHHYKVRFKGKVEQFWEMSGALYDVVAIEKEAFGLPSTTVANNNNIYI